ncbi:MAG: hypothetical protein M1343_13830 [Chloroflexi bacterium]|nr:hypothetical protein [Chloroflexota bacterium]MDA8186925.1 hypothetical protein [Dehalococcoidales bacterium]
MGKGMRGRRGKATRPGTHSETTGLKRPAGIIGVIAVLNQMEADGIVDRYAIGGAVGATFYLEPVATQDVDVFVAFKGQMTQGLIDPRPVFDYLIAHGGRVEGKHIVIAGWPVQLLPSTGPLVDEALAEAITMDVADVSVRVLTGEHLATIALDTGRIKDHLRLLQFIETGTINMERFEQICRKHGLLDKWRAFERKYPEVNSES